MINRCDNDHQHLAGWTPDGKMFVIKDQKVFSEQIIPQFFDHNKFTSFARQLNFYGFRKMQVRDFPILKNDLFTIYREKQNIKNFFHHVLLQSKSIYKGDVDKDTAKYVTFFNEKFQRDRPDLLKEIQRSTKGGQNNNISQEQQREINALKDKVARLEQTIQMMQNDFSGRLAALETQMYQYASYSSGQHAMSYSQTAQNDTGGDENYNQGGGDNGISNQTEYPSPTRINNETNEENTQQPTLAPHPNSKVLPDSRVLPAPPRQSSMRMDSFLRGFSQASLPDLAPFEQKYFQNAISGPDPVDGGVPSNDQSPAAASGGAEAPVPQLNKPGGLTRQLSEGLQRLDLSLSEFPALSSV